MMSTTRTTLSWNKQTDYKDAKINKQELTIVKLRHRISDLEEKLNKQWKVKGKSAKNAGKRYDHTSFHLIYFDYHISWQL